MVRLCPPWRCHPIAITLKWNLTLTEVLRSLGAVLENVSRLLAWKWLGYLKGELW